MLIIIEFAISTIDFSTGVCFQSNKSIVIELSIIFFFVARYLICFILLLNLPNKLSMYLGSVIVVILNLLFFKILHKSLNETGFLCIQGNLTPFILLHFNVAAHNLARSLTSIQFTYLLGKIEILYANIFFILFTDGLFEDLSNTGPIIKPELRVQKSILFL